jgi:hypothetical protein
LWVFSALDTLDGALRAHQSVSTFGAFSIRCAIGTPTRQSTSGCLVVRGAVSPRRALAAALIGSFMVSFARRAEGLGLQAAGSAGSTPERIICSVWACYRPILAHALLWTLGAMAC